MDNREIKNLQRVKYDVLLKERLPKLIESAGCSIEDGIYDLKCTMFPINTSLIHSQDNTDYYPVRAMCDLTNHESGETISFNLDLIHIPVFYELGFKIRGNYMQVLDMYERATGWCFTYEHKRSEKVPEIAAKALGKFGRTFTFMYDKGLHPYVDFRNSKSKRNSISVGSFFRAITGMSNSELLSIFDSGNPFVVAAFSDDSGTAGDCIMDLAQVMFDANRMKSLNTVAMADREIKQSIYSPNYLDMGESNYKRFSASIAYKRRAVGKLLAETIEILGKKYSQGSVITTELAELIDASPINSLKVRANDKVYDLKKFTHFNFQGLGAVLDEDIAECNLEAGKQLLLEDLQVLDETIRTSLKVRWGKGQNSVTITRRIDASSLTQEDLFTAFSIFIDNVNGYDLYDKPYELSNRVCVTFDDKIYDCVASRLNSVTRSLKRLIRRNGVDQTLLLALSELKLNENSNLLLSEAQDTFIDEIRSTSAKEGQMSDMCNTLAFISKSNKVTTDVGENQATPSMRNVQDTQQGRLDPFDSPESSKIGLVHHRTLLADTDCNGMLTAPYLEVKGGEVISDKPVMLTAYEELGKNIAAWNESFKEADGSYKKMVSVRCDNKQSVVPIEKVHYKEYSPVQDMSAAHAMVTLANHSNGKRITMACNQAAQAIPTVNNPERPLLGTGCESIVDFGNYKAKDVLNSYFENVILTNPNLKQFEERIKGSNIKLDSIAKIDDSRVLRFTIMEMSKIVEETGINVIATETLTIPYNLKNFNDVLFSFRLNHKANKIYEPEDIVAYSNCYSLENKERVDLLDFGSMPVDSSCFEHGLALGRNLLCGYKTCGSSTIEDALTISDSLIYDETLTHVRVTYKKEIASNSEIYNRDFGIASRDFDYFDESGLPIIGTTLKSGDPYVSMIKSNKNGGSIHAEYRYLRAHEGGQVIKAEIIRKNNEAEAIVTFAKRNAIENGDKMSGRHGNKGVIARILPKEQMPYDPKTGRTLDILLNPLGVPSRQNISQLLEVAIAMCRYVDGKSTNISPYHPDDIKFIKEQVNKFDVHPIELIDGRTGQKFKRPINVGVIYMSKLHHVAESKMHSIGFDAPADPTFLQPKKGSKNEGGQSFGEMENWSLHGVGANNILKDIYGMQSDDLISRDKFQKKLLGESFVSIDGDEENANYNDAVLLAFIRSLGSELYSNQEDNCYELRPLTDRIIKSFSAVPVESADGLHNAAIFGRDAAGLKRTKVLNKKKWGWIDLGVKMVHPTWLRNGTFSKCVNFIVGGNDYGLTRKIASALIAGNLYIEKNPEVCNSWIGYSLSESSAKDSSSLKAIYGLDDDRLANLKTGMKAVVSVIEDIDIQHCITRQRNAIANALENGHSKTSKKYVQLVEQLAIFEGFAESGSTPADYVITSFPVMPQSFRVEIDSTKFANGTPDFDYYYQQILTAAEQCKNLDNCENEANLYKRISEFVGYQETSNQKYRHLLGYFTGKNNDSHGKIRAAVQSKRIICAGRAVIHPARESIKPTELGVPISMLVKMAQIQLTAYFSKLAKNPDAHLIPQDAWKRLFTQLAVGDFDKFTDVYLEGDSGFFTSFGMKTYEAFKTMYQWIIDYFEKDRADRPVVILGRQPTLHKYGIRSFYPTVLQTKAIELCALLCKGYNADFDGDQAWITLALSDAARVEALEKISPAVDFINPKNSSIMLSHSQDIVLGCYVATMLKDNATSLNQSISDAVYYFSASTLEADVAAGLVELHDLVCFNTVIDGESACYLSTAGRILFNQIFEDGFTTEPFTNPLGIAGVKNERFYNLKYDGIITSGKSGNDPTPYYSLPDICMERYLTMNTDSIEEYHRIAQYGFYYSDLVGVSISFEDLDIESNKEQILKEVSEKKTQLEQDFQDGLVSYEDKKNAIVALYNDEENGAMPEIMGNLLSNLSRNNNIFIMMDSGARGNKTQVMHMCGAIGILGKTKSENMEDAITGNYYEGLTSLEVQMTSYSSRLGVASTQMETRNAGYATRKVVYMTDGVSITKSDCGKKNWWFEITWDDIRPELSVFYPTERWYASNLQGAKLISLNGTDTTGVCDDDLFKELADKGFHEVVVETEGKVKTIVAEPDLLRGAKIDEEDKENQKLFQWLLNDGHVGMEALIAFDHYKIKDISTNFGRLTCRYKMSPRCRSELLYREARNLAYLQTSKDSTTSDQMDYITNKTLDWVEEQGLDVIEARVMLDCECAHGICAHCFGLKFSNLQIPKVGDIVGTESAQSIGEPAAQLTLDVINKGGVAGASIASGVDIFSAYLNGSVYNKDAATTAAVPIRSGYVRISKLDDSVSIAVEPVDKKCTMCRNCIYANEDKGGVGCPLGNPTAMIDPKCAVPKKTPLEDVLVRNGEWVKSGDPITAYTPISDNIVSVDDSEDPDLLLRKKQITWVDNYYNVFSSQSIQINARHFEVLALVQNESAVVVDSDNDNFRVGHTHTVSELRAAVKDGSKINYAMHTTNLRNTILNNSGLLTALTFSHQPDTLQKATFRNLKSSCKYNTSPIGKITVGQDIAATTVKQLPNTSVELLDYAEEPIVEDSSPQFVKLETPNNSDLDLTSTLNSFNIDVFGDLFDDVTESVTEETVKETEVVEDATNELSDVMLLDVVVKYSFDGVINESLTEHRTVEFGVSVLPDDSKIPAGYKVKELSEDTQAAYSGEEFIFEFGVAKEAQDVPETEQSVKKFDQSKEMSAF